jgi:hypothetical protein
MGLLSPLVHERLVLTFTHWSVWVHGLLVPLLTFAHWFLGFTDC